MPATLITAVSRRARPHAWPALTGLALGALVLGPGLRRGYLLAYDMVFVPDPPLGAADFGLGGGPPRAVPSDLFVALAARVIPADIVQKLILLAFFTIACAGAAALAGSGLAERSRFPQLAAGVYYAWNPFVAERLIMGQWAILLGYAGLPWLVREVSRGGRPIRIRRLAAALLPAAIGGFAAMSISALAAIPVAALSGPDQAGPDQAGPDQAGPDQAGRGRRLALTACALVVASLPWLIPSLAIPVHVDPAGAQAFAARPDTPFSGPASLLMLGGIWNSEAVPAGYGGTASLGWLGLALLATAGFLLAARSWRLFAGLGAAAAAGFGLAAASLSGSGQAALHALIALWPGFAMLRDTQQFLAPLALAQAVGLGAGIAWLLRAGSSLPGRSVRSPAAPPEPASERSPARPATPARPARPAAPAGPAVALAVMALLAPVLLLPGLGWGAAGRLTAVTYPADWQAARRLIDADRRPGSVLLLPWAQYRRYPWNRGTAVYDPWPRLLSRQVDWNDALQVGRLTVAAESPAAIRTGEIIGSGPPFTAPMRAAGVRYVVIDAGPLLGERGPGLAARAGFPGAQVLIANSDLILLRISG